MNISQKKDLSNKFQSFNFDCFNISFNNSEKLTPKNCGQDLVDCFDVFKKSAAKNKILNIFTKIMMRLDILEDNHLFKAGMMIAKNIDNGLYFKKDNQYHNSQHTIEVMLTTYHLVNLHNAFNKTYFFSNYETAIMLLSALIHDLNHDGTGNQGIFLRLEQKSFNSVKEILLQNKVPQDEQDIIEALVLSTDINCSRKPLEKIKKHYEQNAARPRIPKNIKKFELFLNNPKAFYMALILCDADLIPSVALSLNKTKHSSQKIYNEETKNNYKSFNIKAKKYFLRFAKRFLNKGFESDAGKFYNNNLEEIISDLQK